MYAKKSQVREGTRCTFGVGHLLSLYSIRRNPSIENREACAASEACEPCERITGPVMLTVRAYYRAIFPVLPCQPCGSTVPAL